MSGYLSRHNPLIASGRESVIGSLEVNTGLRKIKDGGATVSRFTDGTPATEMNYAQACSVRENYPKDGWITIYGWKITANDNGTLIANTSAAKINWLVIGD